MGFESINFSKFYFSSKFNLIEPQNN